VTSDQCNLPIAESQNETKGVPDGVQDPEGSEIAIKVGVPALGAAVTPLIGRHDMELLRCERQHHLSPGIGELRKAVQQQNQRPAARLMTGLEHMHIEAVDVARKAGADAAGKRGTVQRRQISHARLLWDGTGAQPRRRCRQRRAPLRP
jgi:hypothetical protein